MVQCVDVLVQICNITQYTYMHILILLSTLETPLDFFNRWMLDYDSQIGLQIHAFIILVVVQSKLDGSYTKLIKYSSSNSTNKVTDDLNELMLESLTTKNPIL
jgi:hypothetical protein